MAAQAVEPAAIIEAVAASGLRGRGGAGFPTGRKWQAVAENRAPEVPSAVIVNAAEGEPGTFKDRAILRRNPYLVVEGALIAAWAVGADLVVFATKRSFEGEVERLRSAVEEADVFGWSEGVELLVFEGPDEYLYGEESALLETIDGRWPFPRVVPTFRRGLHSTGAADAPAAPALVNNTETLANVSRIIARGPSWFRTVGTDESPGTMVCTVTGYTRRHGVGEVHMGTPLREVIDEIGGGPREGRRVKAVMPGVASGIVPASQLDTPVSYEGMEAIDSGLGAAGFIVFDDASDLAAVAHGVSRFLAVESCGQCTPCKQDGVALAEILDRLRRSEGDEHDLEAAEARLATVADRARCYLALQHQRVVQSIFRLFPDELRAHATRALPGAAAETITAIVDIDGDLAVLDERHLSKQPDWTFDAVYSGQAPADRIDQRTPGQA